MVNKHDSVVLFSQLLFLFALCIMHGYAADPVRTGKYTTTFTESSPMSRWDKFIERIGATLSLPKGSAEPENAVYKLAEEPFDIYVPKSYDGSIPYGLIAYVHAANGGGPIGDYQKICDERKLIWIGGSKIPNERQTWDRIRITLDGIYNIKKNYAIDENRIYGMGLSGGGRITSIMAVPYADVFSGGAIYLIGCNNFVLPAEKEVATTIETKAKTNRYAFVTGSEDFNKPGTVEVHDAYKKLQFPYIAYFEQPGLAHSIPSVEYFAQVMDFVDSPVIAEKEYAAGVEFEAQQQWLEAYKAYKIASSNAFATTMREQAMAALERLRPTVETTAQAEIDKLLVRPNGNSLRAFISKWPSDIAAVSQARATAEKIATEEYEKKIEKNPRASTINTFLKTWDGYAVCEKAIAALDKLAQKEWPQTLASKPGTARWKALANFAETWKPTPTSSLAEKTMMDEIREKITEAEGLKTNGAKIQRLKLLYIETRNTPANQAVQTALIKILQSQQQ